MSQLQIFGREKCRVTRKVERFFKERRIPFQLVQTDKKGLSPGELDSVARAVGGMDNLIDTEGKEYAMIKYLLPDARREKLLQEPSFLKTPIVRLGNRAAVGDNEALWREFAASLVPGNGK